MYVHVCIMCLCVLSECCVYDVCSVCMVGCVVSVRACVCCVSVVLCCVYGGLCV